MAPKRKDKSKSNNDWLQCSLCGKLILPSDAEIHSKSCEAEHAFILGKCLTGKVAKADDITEGGDKTLITKNVRDKDSLVWLSVPAMTMCEIAIGQYVVIGDKTVKRVWPMTLSSQVGGIGLTKQSMDELKVKDGSFLKVQKLHCKDHVVESAVLKLMDSNTMFESAEFRSFASSYLDGTFLTVDSRLRIKYFGQVCHCHVSELQLSTKTSNTKFNSSSLSESFAASDPTQSLPSNGQESSPQPCLVATTPKSHTSIQSPSNSERTNSCLEDNELSTSFSGLSLDKSESDISLLNSSTPRSRAKHNFPTLETPTTSLYKSIEGSGDCNHSSFGKVVSGFSRISIEPVGAKKENGNKTNEPQGSSLSNVGGMMEKIEELKRRISRAQQPGSLGQCILVHGASGTGKTLLVRAVVNSLPVHSVCVAGTDVWSKMFGQAESNLRNIFKSATDKSPSIIVIDDMDVICPKRSRQGTGQQEHRIVGTLLSLVDGSGTKKTNGSVVVIGITNNPDDLDPAIRRSGRFGCEVEIGVPNPKQRAEILNVMLRKVPHCLMQEDIESVAKNAHGYVGADLTALINEASIHAYTRQSDTNADLCQDDAVASIFLTLEDFVHAGQLIKPSALREIQLEVPEVRWSDIGGMSEVKMRLREAVELPLSHPALYKNLGIEPPRGLLMYGPPGCSKTMIARAVATECHLNFLAVKGPELFNQYVGESEKAIREVFRKARAAAPSVIFFDEIDAISAKRGSGSGGSGVDDRVLTQLLTEMDGLEHLKDVFIMAATNRPDKIDRALLRPGRFDSLVYVPLPDDDTRQEILEVKLRKMKVSSDVKLDDLVESTLDYSGAEIIQLCQEAALTALREDIHTTQVQHRHFETAATKVLPQTDVELLQIYQKFSKSR